MLSLILAIMLWGILHSWLASTGRKAWFHHTFGTGAIRFYRLFYNIFAVISFLPVLYLMAALPDQVLYQVPAPYSYLMRVAQLVSLLLLFAAVLQTDVLSFAGLRQLVQEEPPGSLVTSGLYRFVRHPLYTFSLLILWLSPTISINSFVVFTALTLYVLIGIIFEERKLLREFGQNYATYRSETPMLIPGKRLRWNK